MDAISSRKVGGFHDMAGFFDKNTHKTCGLAAMAVQQQWT